MKRVGLVVSGVLLLAAGCKKDDKAGAATTGSASGSAATPGSATATGSATTPGSAAEPAESFPPGLLAATSAMVKEVDGLVARLAKAADCDAKATELTAFETTLRPMADTWAVEYDKADRALMARFDSTVGEKMTASFAAMAPHLEPCKDHPGVQAAAMELSTIGQ